MNSLPQRKNIRLRKYDYSSDGYYFVTMDTYRQKPIINKYKQEVEVILLSLPGRFPGLTIDWYVLMPTHVHVIFIFQRYESETWRCREDFQGPCIKKYGASILAAELL